MAANAENEMGYMEETLDDCVQGSLHMSMKRLDKHTLQSIDEVRVVLT